MTNPKRTISVLIAIKEADLRIISCLKGFLNQTVAAHEVIIVGEDQKLRKIIKQLHFEEKKKIKFVPFLGDKNGARNIGFRESAGDFILYVDQDMTPQTNLMENCMKMLKDFDAIIIPEKGKDGPGFLEKVHSLEKELVMEDIDALTPRLFRRSMFKNGEMPFDRKFGILDEWGFNLKLKTKKPRIGTVESYLIVSENLTLWEKMKKNFEKGRWMHNLLLEDKKEGLRRINPARRGIQFYGSRLNILKKQPILFSALVFIKFVDFLSFLSGFLVAFIKKPIINSPTVNEILTGKL